MSSKRETTSLTRRTLLASGGALLAMPALMRTAWAREPVTLGVVMPLSGAAAQFGINSRDGIQLAVDEINAAGGLNGAPVKLIVADATSNATNAATVAQRMISQEKLSAMLGCFVSGLTMAVSEVTERRGIPLLSVSFADSLMTRGFKTLFSLTNTGTEIGRATFDYTLDIAKENGAPVSKVALMYEDTAYGSSQAGGLRKAAEAAGIKVVMDAAYPLGITDVSPLITELRQSAADVVFPVSYLNDSLLIIRSMRQQGLKLPVVGGAAGYVIPNFVESLGPYAEGVLSIAPCNHDQVPAFAERFRQRFGHFMTWESQAFATLVGCLQMAVEASGDASPAGVQKALQSMTFDKGLATMFTGGKVRFDARNINEYARPIMVQWRDGNLVTVYPKQFALAQPVWKS